MPVLTSCEARSPPAGESPPRKKFKLSLKLKTRKRVKTNNPMDSDNENDSGEENDDLAVNSDGKGVLNSSLTKSTSNMTDANTTFSFQCETVSPPLPYTGLANLGNTCYLNAVVQVLRYCPGFLKTLINLDEISAQNVPMSNDLTTETASSSEEDFSLSKRPSIIHSIHKLTNVMKKAEENYNKFGVEANEVKVRSGWTTLAVRPQDFVKDFSCLCPLFSGYQQHDAQEFLRSFLSAVEEECVGLVKGEQQENVKGNPSITNNRSKVRGGCKYPSTITSTVAMKAEEKPAKMVLTDESIRVSPNVEDSNNIEGPSSFQTTMLKSVEKVASAENENVVKQLFEGTLLLQTCCLSCEGVRQRYENFQDISVPVQNTKSENCDEYGNNLSDSEDESDQDHNLSWAISKFASIERLNGDNKYFCDNCATLTEADISTYFEKLPQVLTIHLKRFQTSYGSQSLYPSSWVTKVTKSLHTPQQLSLKKWCSKTCSENNETYSLFGVVMHSGMSSCSGHYLSYVNVDVLQRQNDGGRNVKRNGCSTSAQCQTCGESKEAMHVNGSCTGAVDECCNIEVSGKTAGDSCQDESVECGPCQNSAATSDDVSTTTQSDDDVKRHRVSIFGKNDILGMCAEESRNQSMMDRNFVCDANVKKDNVDLCCDETIAMDLDEEDTCDDSRKRKSDTQLRRKTPLRNCKTNTDTNSEIDSENSSDEEVVPRSMDITRYFKPIPRKSTVQRSTRASNVMVIEKDKKDACSQKNCRNELKPGNVQKSQDSSFRKFEKMPRSDEESLKKENTNRRNSCSQSVADKKSLPKSPDQCSTFEDKGTSSRDSTGQSSFTHKTEDGEDSEDLTLELNMEPSDEPCASDKTCSASSLKNCSHVHSTQDQSNTDTADYNSLSENCSNQSTKHVCSEGTYDCSNVTSSTWLKFDDAEVQEVSAKDMEGILSPSFSCYSTPYLLFYYRS